MPLAYVIAIMNMIPHRIEDVIYTTKIRSGMPGRSQVSDILTCEENLKPPCLSRCGKPKIPPATVGAKCKLGFSMLEFKPAVKLGADAADGPVKLKLYAVVQTTEIVDQKPRKAVSIFRNHALSNHGLSHFRQTILTEDLMRAVHREADVMERDNQLRHRVVVAAQCGRPL